MQDSSHYTYKTAVGVRAFGSKGVTLKHFIKPQTAVEGIVAFYPNAFTATVLIEKYTPALDEPGLSWYYGVGGHIAAQSDVDDREDVWNRRNSGALGIGIDGIFGIEYKVYDLPLAVSFDLKPFLEIDTKGEAFIALDPGLGLKLTF